MRKPARTVIVASALLSVLSACATSTNVSDINADKRGYLLSAFAPENISSGVLAKVQKNDVESKNFREVEIRVRTDYDDSAQITHPTISTTYIDAGHGMVQQLSVLSKNAIPYKLWYSLTYRGIMSLKAQDVPLKATYASPPAITKNIVRLPTGLATAQDDTEYKFEYTAGRENQIADFWKFGITCKFGRRYAANSLHRNLSGDARDLLCEYSKDGVLDRKTKYVFLQQYGFAVLLDVTGVTYKANGTITDVEIR